MSLMTDGELEEQTWTCEHCDSARSDDDNEYATTEGLTIGDCCISAYTECEDCYEHTAYPVAVNSGDRQVCASCNESNYFDCDSCNERQSVEWSFDVDGAMLCEGCWEDQPYCEECERTYLSGNESDHEHTRPNCWCHQAPMGITSVPGGASPSTVDTDITVSIVGGIDQATINAVGRMIYATGLPNVEQYMADAVSNEWKNEDGTYPKRLRRYVYKTTKRMRMNVLMGHADRWVYDFEHRMVEKYGPWMDEKSAERLARGVNLPDDVVTKIGSLCEPFSRPVERVVQATRDLNQEAYDFCNDESCWWGIAADYDYSRCTFKYAGGIAFRSFSNWGECTGRFLALPIRVSAGGDVTACPNWTDANAWISFNAYGDLEESAAPRVLTALTGLPSKKVQTSGSWMMYLNNDGYVNLHAEPDLLDQVPSLYANLTCPC